MWSPSCRWGSSNGGGFTARSGSLCCTVHIPVSVGHTTDARGLHAFVCKMAPSRITRHHALNDIISRAFASAKIPVTNEPSGLFRSDGKRPDDLTLIPWQRGLSLTWDVTVATTLADSYTSTSASSVAAAAEKAASRKQTKYAALAGSYVFQPIVLETLGPINETTVQFLNILATESLLSLSMITRHNFSFSDSLSPCRGLTPSCCMSRSKVMSNRTFRRPALFNLLSF